MFSSPHGDLMLQDILTRISAWTVHAGGARAAGWVESAKRGVHSVEYFEGCMTMLPAEYIAQSWWWRHPRGCPPRRWPTSAATCATTSTATTCAGSTPTSRCTACRHGTSTSGHATSAPLSQRRQGSSPPAPRHTLNQETVRCPGSFRHASCGAAASGSGVGSGRVALRRRQGGRLGAVGPLMR